MKHSNSKYLTETNLLCYNIDIKYFGITLDETSAIEIYHQFNMCNKANGQLCVLNVPLLPLANPPTCLSPLYTKDKNSIQKRCSLHIRKTNSVSIATSIAPNVWIITSSPTATPAGITLICPGEAPKVLQPQTPIHVLRLKPACSATSQHFHLPPIYKPHKSQFKHIIEYSQSKCHQHICTRIQNMEAPRRSLEYDLTSTFSQYTFGTP